MTVAGVSPQAADSHAAFAARHALPFTLLCDPDKVLIKAYGVTGPLGFGVRRASFLINTAGMIEDAVLADLRIARHEAFFRRIAGGRSGLNGVVQRVTGTSPRRSAPRRT